MKVAKKKGISPSTRAQLMEKLKNRARHDTNAIMVSDQLNFENMEIRNIKTVEPQKRNQNVRISATATKSPQKNNAAMYVTENNRSNNNFSRVSSLRNESNYDSAARVQEPVEAQRISYEQTFNFGDVPNFFENKTAPMPER